MSRLKIGDKLYKYVILHGAFCYEVYEVRENKDSITYALRCEMCKDHEPCEILIAQDDNKDRYKYVMMLNDDEFNQYYWHTSDDEYYYSDKKKALKLAYEKRVKEYSSKIENLNKEIKRYNMIIDESKNLIKNL